MRALVLATVAMFGACDRPRPAPVESITGIVELAPHGGAPTAPLIIGLHGLGDSPEGFAHVFSAFPVAAQIELLPGFEPYQSGRAWFLWPPGTTEDQLVALIDAAERRLWSLIETRAKGRPVLIVGFSQGAMLAYVLAARHPAQIRLAIPVAGRLPPPLWPKQPAAPVFALHGTADQRITVDDARAAIAGFLAAGGAAELREFAGVPHTITPEMRDVIYAELAAAF